MSEARHAAEQMGALSTVANMDLSSRGLTCRWELAAYDAHAQAAVAAAEQLGLDQVRAKALAVLTGGAACWPTWNRPNGMPPRPSRPSRRRMLDGFSWASRGAAACRRRSAAATEPYAREWRSWPAFRMPNQSRCGAMALLLAGAGDRRAARAIRSSPAARRRLPDEPEPYRLCRGGSGRAGRAAAAETNWRRPRRRLHELRGLGRAGEGLRRPRRARRRWGDPLRWLTEAEAGLTADLPHLAGHCRELLKESQPNPWVAAESPPGRRTCCALSPGLANPSRSQPGWISPRTVAKPSKACAQDRRPLPDRLVAAASPARSATPSGRHLPRPLGSPVLSPAAKSPRPPSAATRSQALPRPLRSPVWHLLLFPMPTATASWHAGLGQGTARGKGATRCWRPRD